MYKSKYLQPQINTAGLIVRYKLWAGLTSPGKVFDYSLNNNTGTVVSAPPATFPGFAFDGTADYINAGTTFQSTFRASFSISIWIKPDDGIPAGVEIPIGSVNASTEDSISLSIRTISGKMRFSFTSNINSAYAEESTASFTNGVQPWTHVVLTAEADTQLRIYANGVERTIGSGASGGGVASGLTFSDWTSVDNLYVGGRNSNGSINLPFAGKIDDVMIFDVEKSATEVRSIYELSRWRYGV